MDDHEIVDLYWQRDEHAIEATAAKYESYCMKNFAKHFIRPRRQ